MERKTDVTALGELLIDFTNNGVSAQGNSLFEANPGGAPCNVLAMLRQYGRETAFIGKVGQDMFGQILKGTLEEIGINTGNLLMDESVPTTLAFIKTFEDGDREFSFYRNPGADVMLTDEEVDEALIADSKIFHFGSVSMTHGSARKATVKGIELAKKHKCLISFDPNLREPLWASLEEARKQIDYALSQCDILKIADNEIVWFTGKEDYDEGAAYLIETYGISLVLVTLGKDGSRAYHNGCIYERPGFIQEDTIETTGAGDTFCATILEFVLRYGIGDRLVEHIEEMLRVANGSASLITTRKGALRVMPSVEEIEDLLAL